MKTKIISIIAVLGFYIFLLVAWVCNPSMNSYPEGALLNGWQVYACFVEASAVTYGLVALCIITIRWLLK